MFERLSHSVQRQLRNVGLLTLRVGFGGLLLFNYGLAKARTLALDSGSFPDPLGIGSELSLALAAFAELVCAGLVVVGLFTRLASIPIVLNMMVAALVVHAGDPWSAREAAVLYAIPFVTLFFTGGGAWSLDRALKARRARRKEEERKTRYARRTAVPHEKDGVTSESGTASRKTG